MHVSNVIGRLPNPPCSLVYATAASMKRRMSGKSRPGLPSLLTRPTIISGPVGGPGSSMLEGTDSVASEPESPDNSLPEPCDPPPHATVINPAAIAWTRAKKYRRDFFMIPPFVPPDVTRLYQSVLAWGSSRLPTKNADRAAICAEIPTSRSRILTT